MERTALRAPHRVGRNQQKTHDGTIVTDKVNEMWGNGHQPDRHPRGRAGLCFRRRRTRELRKSSAFTPRVQPIASRRSEPVRQAVYRCFGSIAPGVARGLKLRHDHGSNSMSKLAISRSEIECSWAFQASPSFVRQPEGNGVAETCAFIRNLEGELALGADVQNHRGTARRARRIRQALRNETLGSSRAMDTKRPRRVREEQTMPRIAIDPTFAATLPLAA